MPPVPYSPTKRNSERILSPYPPSFATQHYLGTDTTGRDIVARLVYGFRLAMAFAVILLTCNYVVGVALGCAMGYLGGRIRSRVPAAHRNLVQRAVPLCDHDHRLGHRAEFLDARRGNGGLRLDEMTWYMRTSPIGEGPGVRHGGARTWRVEREDPVSAHPAELGVDRCHVHPVLDREPA